MMSNRGSFRAMERTAARRAFRVIAAVAALFVYACAPRAQAPRVDDSDYVFPDLRRGEVNSRDEKALHAAWNDVLTGQTARAEQAANKLLTARPDLKAAQTILGFAMLRANRLSDAETIFGAVLSTDPGESSALLGLAAAKRKQGQLDQALLLYLRAEKLRPRDTALSRRTSETKLIVAEGAIAKAGSLSAEGKKGEAIVMLQRALDVAPELAPVRLELADLLIEAGRRTEALAVLGSAQEADRNITLRMASIRFDDGDLDGAEMALRRGLRDVGDDAEGAALLLRIKERRLSLSLPEPLRAIGDASRITRAELAALVVVRLEALHSKKAVATVEVASDLGRTWARTQIVRALDLGLMDVYPNHTFQPSGIVRRGELAVVAARVLDLIGWGRSNAAAPKDMSPSHLQYGSAVRVLGAGVMQNAPSGAFEPWRVVSGAEAKAVVDSLAKLASQH